MPTCRQRQQTPRQAYGSSLQVSPLLRAIAPCRAQLPCKGMLSGLKSTYKLDHSSLSMSLIALSNSTIKPNLYTQVQMEPNTLAILLS